jgi:hypothetical protein
MFIFEICSKTLATCHREAVDKKKMAPEDGSRIAVHPAARLQDTCGPSSIKV